MVLMGGKKPRPSDVQCRQRNNVSFINKYILVQKSNIVYSRPQKSATDVAQSDSRNYERIPGHPPTSITPLYYRERNESSVRLGLSLRDDSHSVA